MIEGPLQLPLLDLLGQHRLSALTRRFIAALIEPHWLRTETTSAHTRHFFTDFVFPPVGHTDAALREELV